jgi:hypothetical protein
MKDNFTADTMALVLRLERRKLGIRAKSVFNLGILYREQSDRDQAQTHFEKAKALYEMVGDARGAQNAAMELRML